MAPIRRLAMRPEALNLYFTLGNMLLMLPLFALESSVIDASLAFSFVAGVIWAAGNVFAINAWERIGISRAPAIWAAGGVLVSAALGIALFGELVGSAANLQQALLGAFAIAAGALLVGTANGKGERLDRRGIAYSLFAALLYGSYFVPLKYSTASVFANLAVLGLGMLLSAWVIALWQGVALAAPKQHALRGVFSGALWGVANTAVLFAILDGSVGFAKSYSISQASLLVITLWGVLYFREVNGRSAMSRILAGALLIVAGGALLALAKT